MMGAQRGEGGKAGSHRNGGVAAVSFNFTLLIYECRLYVALLIEERILLLYVLPALPI